MNGETYSSEIRCKNCKKINYIFKVPKGKKVEEFLEEEKLNCINCECALYKENEN